MIMANFEVENASSNLIILMEEKLEEIRINLDKIEDQEVLFELVSNIKKEICDLYFDFEGVSENNKNKLKGLKQEYLALIRFYE